MQTARDALTPDALAMLQTIADTGSFAAAARALNLVPSALTYRVRQIEDALDVLLFDRSSRQARMTEAGAELLREGGRLLQDIDAVANRVKRVATGWEPQLTVAADGLMARPVLMELACAFFNLAPPTRLRIRDETLSGTLQALTSGQADLALGVSPGPGTAAGLHSQPMGSVGFVFAVAPHHPWPRVTACSMTTICAVTVPWPSPIRCSAAVASRSACWAGRTCSRCPPCRPSSTRSFAGWAGASCRNPWRGLTSKPAGWWCAAWRVPRWWPIRAMYGAPATDPGGRCSGGSTNCKARSPGGRCWSSTTIESG
jgi:DNA-binding transcriptional LysR family regulator